MGKQRNQERNARPMDIGDLNKDYSDSEDHSDGEDCHVSKKLSTVFFNRKARRRRKEEHLAAHSRSGENREKHRSGPALSDRIRRKERKNGSVV